MSLFDDLVQKIKETPATHRVNSPFRPPSQTVEYTRQHDTTELDIALRNTFTEAQRLIAPTHTPAADPLGHTIANSRTYNRLQRAIRGENQ